MFSFHVVCVSFHTTEAQNYLVSLVNFSRLKSVKSDYIKMCHCMPLSN